MWVTAILGALRTASRITVSISSILEKYGDSAYAPDHLLNSSPYLRQIAIFAGEEVPSIDAERNT